jgi:hypothetical protein
MSEMPDRGSMSEERLKSAVFIAEEGSRKKGVTSEEILASSASEIKELNDTLEANGIVDMVAPLQKQFGVTSVQDLSLLTLELIDTLDCKPISKAKLKKLLLTLNPSRATISSSATSSASSLLPRTLGPELAKSNTPSYPTIPYRSIFVEPGSKIIGSGSSAVCTKGIWNGKVVVIKQLREKIDHSEALHAAFEREVCD